MTDSHTKGPWEVVKHWLHEDRREIRPLFNGPPEAGGNWATLAETRNYANRAEANAQLIAAAPDLLEALKDMAADWKCVVDYYGDLHGVDCHATIEKADAAIAKAEPK